jgi:hypothetical protein
MKQPSKSARCYFMLVSYLFYSPTMNMEVICFSKILVEFHRATWHYIVEDRNIHCVLLITFTTYAF